VPTILGLGAGGPSVLSVGTPTLRLGPLPAETASEAVGITPDVAALVTHTEFGGAIDAADRLVVDRVVDPDALRGEVLAALRLA
jgi:hypothetical protein